MTVVSGRTAVKKDAMTLQWVQTDIDVRWGWDERETLRD